MKTKLMGLGIALLAGAAMFAQPRVSIGVGIGGYAPGAYAPAYAVQPPCPGPDYAWVDGYWSQYRGHRNWTAGYWQRRPHYEQRFYGNGRDSRNNNDYRYNNQQRYNNDQRYNNNDQRSNNNRSFGNGFRNR
jgi:hypothetical protein